MNENTKWHSFYDKLPTDKELILVCIEHHDHDIGKFITLNRYGNDGGILILIDSGDTKICYVKDIKNISLWQSISGPQESLWDDLENKSREEPK